MPLYSNEVTITAANVIFCFVSMFKIQTKCMCFQTIYSYQLPTGPDVIFFFMFNSAEHGILNAGKYKNIEILSIF